MTYSPAELIRYNLAQLRKHMLAQGCTDQDWKAALLTEVWPEIRNGITGANMLHELYSKIAPRDPENLGPYGAQNHPIP